VRSGLGRGVLCAWLTCCVKLAPLIIAGLKVRHLGLREL
jgi:hypothetical protein